MLILFHTHFLITMSIFLHIISTFSKNILFFFFFLEMKLTVYYIIYISECEQLSKIYISECELINVFFSSATCCVVMNLDPCCMPIELF